HVYLDYTGGGLYAESQLQQQLQLLQGGVFGNPHSNNPTSLAATQLVEQARAYVLEFFNASPDEYVAIFTPNASGAIKLVGEAYPFDADSNYLLTLDNHNSVQGIREFARSKGATVSYVPVLAPELRIDPVRLEESLDLARPAGHHLFAFPAQSNFSGTQHPLELIERAQARGWDVLVDAAAFAPTNRLDLGAWKPDFVPISFYKMFGYPTGMGCLLARREALDKLQRPWFAGGTITIASAQADRHFLADGEAGFEDGTVNYLNIPAVEIGLRYLKAVGMDTIHERVRCLTGWLLGQLQPLRHSNGRPLVRLHGGKDLHLRGGTITVNFDDPEGRPMDGPRIEQLANHEKISLRTGCFCNPGAGEVAHDLPAEVMDDLFQYGRKLSFLEMRDVIEQKYGKNVSAVRISVGLASNFSDVYRLLKFVRGLLDRTAKQVGRVPALAAHGVMGRDTA
ncbi:MAG: aminotransferase class V-fold PLP-dependent enzyme, partial [Chloroflexia bacterium]|nr:aminotransferase class V-fold PLP-dependent enzyme [Chloroflexia bacterium]